jgi:hypothetical protein
MGPYFIGSGIQYLDQEEKVVYTSNDGGTSRIFPLQTRADTIYGDPEYSWDAYVHA